MANERVTRIGDGWYLVETDEGRWRVAVASEQNATWVFTNGQVARIEAQVVQRRTVHAGETCGYGATFTAEQDTQAAILNIGYADGYLRGFSSRGMAFAGEMSLPVIGRVSMDLIAVRCDAAPDIKEGDWVELDYDLPDAAHQSGLSQYELLTTLGSRFERRWI